MKLIASFFPLKCVLYQMNKRSLPFISIDKIFMQKNAKGVLSNLKTPVFYPSLLIFIDFLVKKGFLNP